MIVVDITSVFIGAGLSLLAFISYVLHSAESLSEDDEAIEEKENMKKEDEDDLYVSDSDK